ncbi:MAG: hypothetical protein F6K17_00930 [Okeania sp. SIO3C4]|nr:hypothetical protein [Okeania sp. SIO3B3]NER01294.1 hypothetical protein [Okeania sp. SIO3C4]
MAFRPGIPRKPCGSLRKEISALVMRGYDCTLMAIAKLLTEKHFIFGKI